MRRASPGAVIDYTPEEGQRNQSYPVLSHLWPSTVRCGWTTQVTHTPLDSHHCNRHLPATEGASPLNLQGPQLELTQGGPLTIHTYDHHYHLCHYHPQEIRAPCCHPHFP